MRSWEEEDHRSLVEALDACVCRLAVQRKAVNKICEAVKRLPKSRMGYAGITEDVKREVLIQIEDAMAAYEVIAKEGTL